MVAQTPTTYQWQKNGLDLADGGHYAGVDTATLVVSPADRGDVAAYRCVVTHPHGSTVSDSARLVLGTWAFTGIGVRAGASGSTINGLTSDGQIATGESGGQAIIWSTTDGLKVLGLPAGATASSGAGVGLYEGNVVVAVDTNRSSYRAHRWDGNLDGAGTFSALPQAAGSREWLVRSLATDGAEDLWIAGSTLAGGDGNGREACLYDQNAAATEVSFFLPPNSHDHSDFNAVADNGYCAGQCQFGGTSPTGGARNAMKRGSGLGCTALNTIMGPPSTAYEAIAWAISHNGRVLGGGSHYLPGALFKPVIWEDSIIPTVIPFLPGGDQDNTGDVLALNGDGTLAGGYSYRSPSGVREAFIWDAVQGTRSLQQVLTMDYGQVLTGWTLQEVRSISSDRLVLAGIGLNNGRTEGWVVYFVPLAVIADFDGDGDVDQEDFGRFQACLTGTAVPVTDLNCLYADLEGDNDVDQGDFLIFQGCMSGANVPADPYCAE